MLILLNLSLANFAINGISASQVFPLLRKAISICEKSSLKVIAVTCNGSSPYCKLYTAILHRMMTWTQKLMVRIKHIIYYINPETDVMDQTRNLFSGTKSRFLYFISDASHLLKTAWNCLFKYASGKFTRYMWDGGMFLL